MKFALLSPSATPLYRKHPSDAGLDVYASETAVIMPHGMATVKTGVTVEIPEGYCLQVWPKSGQNYIVGAGIIDAGYQGEVKVKIANYGDNALVFGIGSPLAQLVLVKIDVPETEEVSLDVIHQFKTLRAETGGINR